MKIFTVLVAILVLATNIFPQASLKASELTEKAIKQYEEGDLDSALENFTRAIELSSRPRPPRSARSNLIGEPAKDAELRARITFYDPVTATAFLNRAHVHLSRAKIELAIADYSESIKIRPGSAEAFAYRGMAYLLAEKPNEAVDDARRAVKIDPQLTHGHLVLAMALQDLGRHADALSTLNTAIELDPENADGYFRRGDFHRLALRYEMAMADFERATALDATLPGPFTGRGAIRFEQGRYQESIENYSTALRLDSRLLQARRFRGYAYLALGRDDDAERDFSRVLAIAPNFREEIDRAKGQIIGKRKVQGRFPALHHTEVDKTLSGQELSAAQAPG